MISFNAWCWSILIKNNNLFILNLLYSYFFHFDYLISIYLVFGRHPGLDLRLGGRVGHVGVLKYKRYFYSLICSQFKLSIVFSKKFAAAGGGAGAAEPQLQRKFLDFNNLMERFCLLKRSTSRSPLSFFKHF